MRRDIGRILGAAALLAGATAVASAPPAAAARLNDVQVVAALGKLESNVAEAAGALVLHALLPEGSPERDEAARDFRTDIGAIDKYVGLLDGSELPPEAAAGLGRFKKAWAEVMGSEAAGALVAASTEGVGLEAARARAVAYWELVDRVDAAIDDAIDAMLEPRGGKLAVESTD